MYTATRYLQRETSFPPRPDCPPWYYKPGPSSESIPVTIWERDEQDRTKRKRPADLMANPSFYGRRINHNWSHISVSARSRCVSDRYLEVEATLSGDTNGSGYVWRDLSPVPDILVQAALVKARLKLKDQDVNIGQALAERKLTADLVSNNFTKIAKSVIALKRGRFAEAGRYLGISRRLYKDATFFDNFLELQYGWKPLIQDCYGAVAELSDKDQERDGAQQITVKATAKDSAEFYRAISETCGGGYSQWYWTERDEYRAKVVLTYRSSNEALATAAELGLTNPALLAWELLPFSFVVDWALPIGDYFSQFDASLGWEFVAGSLSTTTKCKRPDPSYRFLPYAPVLESYGGGSSNGARALMFYRTVYTREPYAVVPVPKAFDKIASFAHVENAIALLAQAFAR